MSDFFNDWPVFPWIRRIAFLRYGIYGLILIAVSGVSILKAQTLPEIGTEFRTDFEWKDDDQPEDANLSRPTLRFIVKRAHLNLRGKMDDQIEYRLRVRWNQSFAPEDDNTGAGLEYWYLKYQWIEGWHFRVGKHHVLQGGREGARNPIDVFQYSSLGERIQHFYEVGASVFYELGTLSPMLQDQTIVGQIFNQLEGSSENQLALSYNGAWYGSFAGGLIEPVIQYGLFPRVQENERDSVSGKRIITQESFRETYFSLGTLMNLDFAMIEMDLINHQQSSYKERTSSGTVNHNKENNTSFVLMGQLDGTLLAPFAKWVYDSEKQNGSSGTAEVTRNTFQLGTAFFPKIENHNFRLHALISYQETGGDTDDFTEYRLNGGLSARF